MVRLSNVTIALFNFLTLIISILIITSWYQSRTPHNSPPLHSPIIILSLSTMLLSLFGLLGSIFGIFPLLWINLFATFVAIVGLFCFLFFMILVTNKGVENAVAGWRFGEHRLGDYSLWLDREVRGWESWNRIVEELKDARVCKAYGHDNHFVVAKIYSKSLSLIQSGCCKPPKYCGYNFVNATYWTVPESGLTSEAIDCKVWSNDQESLCYGCNSCKVGVVLNIKGHWQIFSIYLFILALFLNIIFSIGCCALQNNRDHTYQRFRCGD